MYHFGWFSSGRDKAARELLEVAYNNIKQGEIKAELPFVFCNREPGESAQSDLFIKLVESYGIPLVCFSYQRYKSGRANNKAGEALPQWRLDYDQEVMKRLKAFNPDLCILAGYMLIVGREMCSRYDMINLHPAAPGGPAGTWQEVIWQLIAMKAKETGVMMHLVTPELDRGPVVTYCTLPIIGAPFDSLWREIEGQDINEIKRKQGESNALFQLIRKYGLKREFPLILATMKAFSQGRVKITGGKVTDFQGKAINGYNLTQEINELIK
jgi:phosphoribosylglycinamide formyltransferase-1